jgi:dTDP-4-amino-4,6-dideoxygalactose transaminase
MSEGLLEASPPLPPGAWLRRRAARLPYPLEAPSCTLYSRARHGLFLGLRAHELEPGDEVLMPAYHHGSEVEATIRAGLSCAFYEGNEHLEPDSHELDRLVGPRTRALHLTHYLGFPQDASRWRAWCDQRGFLLIEDAAQAWLAQDVTRPVGSVGDLVVFCLYKTFGIPDGAALVLRGPAVPPPRVDGGAGLGILARKHAAWLAARSGAVDGALARRRGEPAPYVAEDDFALGEPAPPNALGLKLLRRLTQQDAAAARRLAYRGLLSELGDLVPPPFADCPSGASPFVFPVEVDDKAALLATLRARRIAALDLWSVPHPALDIEQFPAAARRRERTVGLPVHQELRASDLDRIAAALR